jgi:light-independent protochlorophyllide reductase subunit B
MFREDFEFHAGAAPSHLGSTRPAAEHVTPVVAAPAAVVDVSAPTPPSLATDSLPAQGLISDGIQAVAAPAQAASNQATWSPEAEKELGKIPFFVRGKARRNTERFAQDLGVATITVETLYDAKAHFSR